MANKTKFIITEKDFSPLSSKFKILSEESRLKILQILQSGEKSVKEIVEESGFLQANVSKQLKLLNDFNIVQFRTEGKQHFYQIKDKQVLKICRIICESSRENA